MEQNLNKRLFRRAVTLALSARPSPNPRVGAVLVRGGKILSTGLHARAGEAHAEVAALRSAGPKARGAELIVTLEPCHLTGRTPPCTAAIIEAGVGAVRIGALDPTPAENGRSVDILKKAGIKVHVESGEIGAMCLELIEEWAKFITSSVPFVRIKAALSADGKMATASGDSRWISSAASRKEVHRMRARHDAVMVGIGTVLRDDPLLTVRDVRWKGPPPMRIVVDSNLRTPPGSRVLQGAPNIPTIIACVEGDGRLLRGTGAQILHCRGDEDGHVDLRDLLEKLGSLSITSILAEGGSRIITSLIEKRLADAITLFIAPVIIGGRDALPLVAGEGAAKISNVLRLKDARLKKSGADIMLTARF